MAERSGLAERKSVLGKYVTEKIASDGIENFSMRGLCKDTGIAAPRVYDLFACKEDMLESVFLDICRELCDTAVSAVGALPDSRRDYRQVEEACWRMWSTLWYFLTTKREKTLFYLRYILSSYYTRDVRLREEKVISRWLGLVKRMDELYGVSGHSDVAVLQTGVIRDTVSYAAMFIRGELEEKPNTVGTVFSTVFYPVFLALGFDADRKG